MKLAIVGSTCARREDCLSLILKLFDDPFSGHALCLCHPRPEAVISGGARGVDTFAEEAALAAGIPVIVCKPAGNSWQFFKARNILIAELCDALVRIVSDRSKTFGSGWTMQHAARLGKPTTELRVP